MCSQLNDGSEFLSSSTFDTKFKNIVKQDCILVGCIPPVAVAVHGGSGDLPQCMLGYPLDVGLETPLGVGWETPLGLALETPWVWAWRPPWPDPSTSPLGLGLETPLETCKACWDTPQRPAARHAGIPPEMHAGIPPPHVDRMTDTCKNITFANFIWGGNYDSQFTLMPNGGTYFVCIMQDSVHSFGTVFLSTDLHCKMLA